MIDWYSLFGTTLWVLGLAVLLAALSYAWYEAATTGQRLRSVLTLPVIELSYSLGFLVFCLGMVAQAGRAWWETLLWSVLALAFGVQVWSAQRRRRGLEADVRASFRLGFRGDRPLVIGLILLGVILVSIYALVIRPWMQPDEPRHFEVALHVARLGQPVVYYPDLVIEWEQEIIQDMENHDFWWYGYSLIGWDPENLPKTFEEIWGLLYSRAFFQLPIYYSLAGGLLHQWGRDFPLSQAVTGLRLFGALLFGLSLWGIYRTARELFPVWSRLALAALALAALWPSHLAASAAVNNDPLAEVVVIWSIFFAIQILRYGPRPKILLWFSVLILITLFTKRSGFSVLVLLLALPLWSWRQYAAKSSRRGLLGLLSALILALALIAVLFLVIQGTVRNWIPRSFLDSVLSGEIMQSVALAPLAESAEALLRTFVGWFGWMRVPLPEPLYWLGGVVTFVGAGFALVGFAQMFGKRLQGWQRQGLFLLFLILSLQIALTFGKDIVYGLYADGSLPQVRYVYPAISAFLLPMLLGFRRVFSGRWRQWVLPVTIVILLVYNFYILAFVLFPFFWL